MVKSPLRYPGGKSRAIKFIIPLIPEFNEFREPFVGGGSIFIHLKQKRTRKTYWINDIYKNLFLFWRETQQSTDKLIKQIQYWKDNFKVGKELYSYLVKNIDGLNELGKASAFFIFNRITFSGTTESGGFSNSAFDRRFTQSSIERIKILSNILANTKVTNYDYQQVVETNGNNIFIFLDPPYYSTTQSALYGKNGNLHKRFDHERFSRVLKYTKHRWLVTYDDSHYIRNLFSFANIKEWNLTYGMRNVSKKNNQNSRELLISNYEFPSSQKRISF